MEECEQQEKRREIWLYLASALGLTIVISSLLEFFFQGFPIPFIIPIFNEPATLSKIIYLVSVTVSGAHVGIVRLRELLIERRFSVEFLIAIAALSAEFLDFKFEATTMLFLYFLAEYFEDYIKNRARRTVEGLSQFMPDKARVLVNGSEESIDVKEIQLGMTLLVRAGERIALDDTVVEGYSSVEQSIVTGESIPTEKKNGDAIYSGTMNMTGILKVVVTKSAENTLMSRIGKLVVESRKRKASIEKLVDRFARVYVPIVILLAVSTALFGPMIVGGSYKT